MAVVGRSYAIGPTRVQFQEKDPRGWKEFETQLCEHSTLGSANTMRGGQARRPSLYELTESMRSLTVPTMRVTGDDDATSPPARTSSRAVEELHSNIMRT